MSEALVFGKYEIQHRLAVGGMGEVFFARQVGLPGFERPAILKSLLPDLAEEQGFIDQFLDEARVAATLNHPNVVSIYEVGLWNGTYFIAMEYIRGRNLAQLLRRALEQGLELPVTVCMRIIAEAALGLHHAHLAEDAQGRSLHIVHRDISPQNIMVRADGVTKVVDFGIARAANRVSRTATGALKGKVSYMSPEQLLGKPLTQAADQWALGVCFWELLSGARAFKAETDLLRAKLVLEGPITPPPRAGLRPDVSSVVMRMLERDPARRFPSCGAVAEALAALMGEPREEDSCERFMRQLGTDDLVLKLPPTPRENFVVALDRQAATRNARSPVRDQRPRKPRRPLGLLALGLAVLLALGAGAGALAWRAAQAPAVAPVERPALEPGAMAEAVPPPEPAAPSPREPEAELVLEARTEPETPAPAEVTLSIKSSPPRVAVRLDGRPAGSTPLELRVSPGVHYLLAETPGHRRVEREVTAVTGEVLEVELALKPLKGAAEPGFLSIETTPWSKVSVDGEPIGSTPIFRWQLAPGAHTVTCVNEAAGLKATRPLTIKSGKTEKVTLQLK